MEHCGIDLHVKYSEVCIIDTEGEIVEQRKIPTTESALKRFFDRREQMRICVEAGGSSPWVCRVLRELGHDVRVCNPRRVRLIAESTMKTDKVDAEILARLVRIDPGFLGSVRHRSRDTQVLRARLRVRTTLVRARSTQISTIRGLLRSFGYKVRSSATKYFVKALDEVKLPEELRVAIEPLVGSVEWLTTEIDALDAEVAEQGESRAEVQRMKEMPGVGPLVSLSFSLYVEDPTRFSCGDKVASFMGLVPRHRGSGGVEHQGRITKQGDAEMRRLMVQAAHSLLRCTRDNELKQWALALEQRVGKRKAVVALARKMAILMYRLWLTGEAYRPFPNASRGQAA